MKKFTAFTVILTVIIVVVLAELFVNDYLPSLSKGSDSNGELEFTLPDSLNIADSVQTNVLGADVDQSKIPDSGYLDLQYEEIPLNGDNLGLGAPIEIPSELTVPTEQNNDFLQVPTDSVPLGYESSSSDIQDFEDQNFTAHSTNVFLRDDQIKSAGFSGAYLEDETNDGYLFKTIFVGDLDDVEVSKTAIKTDDSLFAKVYVFQVGGLSSVSEVYEVVKLRAVGGLDVEINETNDFGSASFYVNDNRRPNVAFLMVRIGAMLYGFSYPKEYHPQIKNLVTLLDLEF